MGEILGLLDCGNAKNVLNQAIRHFGHESVLRVFR